MDSIDVSKCEFYTNVAGCGLAECVSKGYKTITNFKCKYNNCYYKQLQQLKIENEKLRFPREDIDFAVLTKEEFENYKRLKELEKNTTDATKCGFYHPEHGKECHIALAFADDYTDADHTYLLCEQNPNCYYKQLQQCKSKNEAIHFIADNLQKRNHRLTLKNEELEEQLQQLKAENEKFKNFVAHNLFDVNCDNWLDRFIDYFEKWKHELVAKNEELKEDNEILKDILSYPKYTNENAYNELLKLEKPELIKQVIESHQHGESTSQIVYRRLKEENDKYRQVVDEIEEICKCSKGTSCDECPLCSECEEDCRSDDNLPRILLQLIKQTKEGET